MEIGKIDEIIKILKKNTKYTGSGVLVGFVALIIALIALIK